LTRVPVFPCHCSTPQLLWACCFYPLTSARPPPPFSQPILPRSRTFSPLQRLTMYPLVWLSRRNCRAGASALQTSPPSQQHSLGRNTFDVPARTPPPAPHYSSVTFSSLSPQKMPFPKSTSKVQMEAHYTPRSPPNSIPSPPAFFRVMALRKIM